MKKICIIAVAVLLLLPFGCKSKETAEKKDPAEEPLQISLPWEAPLSQKEEDAAAQVIPDDVYWTSFGHKYHIYPDCQTLNNENDVTTGSVREAIDSGHVALCSFCAKRAGIDDPNIRIEQADDGR